MPIGALVVKVRFRGTAAVALIVKVAGFLAPVMGAHLTTWIVQTAMRWLLWYRVGSRWKRLVPDYALGADECLE